MNICFAIGTLSYSGAEKIMHHLVKEFQKRGHDVSVILLSCDKPYDFLTGIKQFPIDNMQEESTKNTMIRVLKREKRIRNIIKGNEFDILVSFGVKFNLDIAESCFFNKTKLILCERNDPSYDPSSKLLRLRRNISYKRANGFVFQTDTIKSFFSKQIQERSIVIPNFIDKIVDKDNLSLNKKQAFVTCARLDDNQKNQSALINTFAIFSKDYPEYTLEFFGDGPDRKKYEQLVKTLGIENRVFFHGRINNPMEKIKYYQYFVFTSKYEGMPNALIEAMSYGLSCIATDCGGGGAKELINNGKNGLLIPYNNQDELLEAMKWMVTNQDEAKKMGNEAFKINDKLEMQKIINIWEDYFLSC